MQPDWLQAKGNSLSSWIRRGRVPTAQPPLHRPSTWTGPDLDPGTFYSPLSPRLQPSPAGHPKPSPLLGDTPRLSDNNLVTKGPRGHLIESDVLCTSGILAPSSHRQVPPAECHSLSLKCTLCLWGQQSCVTHKGKGWSACLPSTVRPRDPISAGSGGRAFTGVHLTAGGASSRPRCPCVREGEVGQSRGHYFELVPPTWQPSQAHCSGSRQGGRVGSQQRLPHTW